MPAPQVMCTETGKPYAKNFRTLFLFVLPCDKKNVKDFVSPASIRKKNVCRFKKNSELCQP